MEQTNYKRRLWVSILIYLVSIAIVVVLCLFIPKACQKKADTKLDATCTNCTIDGQKEIHNFYPLNDNVTLTVKADIGCSLPDDVKATRGNEQLIKDTDYTYSKDTGELKFVIKGDTNVVVTANKKILNDCSWSEIKAISDSGKASEFFAIGDTKDVTINNQTHKVRIIGFKQDKDKDGKDIGITFEFANLISDSNGYALAAYWNDVATTASSNYNYMTSTIRAALNGEGGTTINWFQYFGADEDSTDASKGTTSKNKHFSTNYSNKSVLSMLPSDLTSVLTAPSKYVSTYDSTQSKFVDSTVNDKLFLLSPKEMGYEKSTYQEQLTSTYSYYAEHTDEIDEIRIKYQTKWHEEARTYLLYGNDLDGSYTGGLKYCYAGFNNTTPSNGGVYWLRSANTKRDDSAWGTQNNGDVDVRFAYNFAMGVAPAFCI